MKGSRHFLFAQPDVCSLALFGAQTDAAPRNGARMTFALVRVFVVTDMPSEPLVGRIGLFTVSDGADKRKGLIRGQREHGRGS